MLSKSSLQLLRSFGPKGDRALMMSPPCRESQGCHLIPFLPAPLLFCLVLLFILSSPSAYFPEMSLNFFFFLVCSFVLPLFLVVVLAASWSVVSVACYLMALVLAIYAFRHVGYLFNFLVMIVDDFFFNFFLVKCYR